MGHCAFAMGELEDGDGRDNPEGPISQRAGRVLSAEKLSRVESAYALAGEMEADSGMHRAGRSMMREAKGYLKSVTVWGSSNPGVTGGSNPGVCLPGDENCLNSFSGVHQKAASQPDDEDYDPSNWSHYCARQRKRNELEYQKGLERERVYQKARQAERMLRK
jgi:hypothetical protein